MGLKLKWRLHHFQTLSRPPQPPLHPFHSLVGREKGLHGLLGQPSFVNRDWQIHVPKTFYISNN